jgi:hypothetical protein
MGSVAVWTDLHLRDSGWNAFAKSADEAAKIRKKFHAVGGGALLY